MYDLKKKFASCHENLNKLRVKLETSLVRLPPSEPSLYQHVLGASLQTKVWLSSNIANPPSLSPYNYRWWKDAAGPLSVFFEGSMTSDFFTLAKEKWCVVGLAFVMNKTCAALNYVPVRVAISV